MIINAFLTIEEINGTGIEGVLQTAANASPILVPLILGAIFVILSFGTFFSMSRRFGKADLPACMSVAGFITIIAALLMSMIPNFINPIVVVTCVVIEILCVLWLFISKD